MVDKRQTPKSLVEWLGFRIPPDWSKARSLGAGLGSLLLLASALLFLGAILAAFFVIGRIVSTNSALSLSSSTLIAALLGAPFVIWGTVLKHLTVSFQKEGHIAETELSVLSRQCLNRRIEDQTFLTSEVATWQADRNTKGAAANWKFTSQDTHIKLRRLYPSI